LNFRRHGWPIAQALVFAMLVGSIPVAASPVIGGHKSGPAITLDICDPLPVFAAGGAACTLPSFTEFSFSVTIADRGPAEAVDVAVIDRGTEAPDPPPPKTLA
jgi:hypothetical protein